MYAHTVVFVNYFFDYSQIEKMLNSPEAIERLISATPGLESDPVALCK